MSTLVTFGEAMVRLAPPGHRRLEQTTSLEVTVGGAELNVASGSVDSASQRLGSRACPTTHLAGWCGRARWRA